MLTSGPVCPYVLSPVSRFSSIWDIPVFTTSGMNAAFRDKTSEYKLLTCLAGDYQQFGEFLVKLFDQYNWRHITFIYDEEGDSCSFGLNQVWELLGGNNNPNVSHFSVPVNSNRLFNQIFLLFLFYESFL